MQIPAQTAGWEHGGSAPGWTDGLRDGDSSTPQPGAWGAAGMAAAGWRERKLLIEFQTMCNYQVAEN